VEHTARRRLVVNGVERRDEIESRRRGKRRRVVDEESGVGETGSSGLVAGDRYRVAGDIQPGCVVPERVAS